MQLTSVDVIKEFNYKGFDCFIKRVGFCDENKGLKEAIKISGSDDFSMRRWWLCGYVVLPEDHPLNGLHYDDLNDIINVHKGLTYSEGFDNDWVIGFDCDHLGDGTKENTEDFVVSEIQSIVDQLIDKDKDLRGLVDDISNGVIV